MGTLFVVATPIGNLDDISARALRILREVPLIAAEDTRHTRKLLSHFGIATPLVSYHAHSPRRRREELLRALAEGDVALVSDAGTPAISDPGNDLVDAALAAGHPVSPIPGPSALVAAASASGLVPGPFVFVGFLPRQRKERQAVLRRAAATGFPIVLFEAPGRVAATLDELSEMLGEREAAMGRELTKLHEEVRRGALRDLAVELRRATPRGEVAIVIAGAPGAGPAAPASGAADVARLLAVLRESGLSASQSARVAAALTGRPRSAVYDAAIARAGGSVGLEGELAMVHQDALEDPLGDQECPERRKP